MLRVVLRLTRRPGHVCHHGAPPQVVTAWLFRAGSIAESFSPRTTFTSGYRFSPGAQSLCHGSNGPAHGREPRNEGTAESPIWPDARSGAEAISKALKPSRHHRTTCKESLRVMIGDQLLTTTAL